MAQQIITLASEETSQDILTRVKRIETDISNIKPTVTQLGGGYPYVKTTGQINIYTAQKTIVVTGKAKVTLWGNGVLSSTSELTIDGIPTETFGLTSAAPPKIEFTCETGMQFKLKANTSSATYTSAVVFAQFASPDGTLTYS